MAVLGVIADDFTGATDIAGMLVKGGKLDHAYQITVPEDLNGLS